jgi:hypothetical protein
MALFLSSRPYGRKQGNGGTRKTLGTDSKLRLKGPAGFGGSFSCLSPQGTRDFRKRRFLGVTYLNPAETE